MRRKLEVALVVSFVLGAVAVAAPPQTLHLVVCSPGSPGSTQEAQPRMDAFAKAVSAKIGTPISAVYEPTDEGGAKQIASAGLAIVSLPFFLAHEQDLGLHARLVAVQEGRPALESWTLVTQKGRVGKAEQLAGFTIASSAGFAPAFVRGAVKSFGTLPQGVKIEQTTAVLSALRRAANGEPVAVLLDGPQAAKLASLPFAAKLGVVAKSPAWPAGLVATVDAKVPEKTWMAIQKVLIGLAADKASAPALAAIQMSKFTPLDEKSLESARHAQGRQP
ncbi:MAG: PhnD/SsuA/transferrin family substrate-binding protein [Kofleriaceae bacterium]|nr:PhnD/SsuA/transferrin family substrate-binding protein [Kofleriaceae bacterium]